MKKLFLILITAVLMSSANASDDKIGTYEKLGNFISLDLVFTDENGMTKTLGEFMSNKPTVISVNYFKCPGVCGPQIDGITRTIDRMELTEGKDYKALTISFVKQLIHQKMQKTSKITILMLSEKILITMHGIF